MSPAWHRWRGSATVEFALVFIAVWTVVVLCWVAGSVALQRNLIKAAARDAAMMVADATPAELASTAAIGDLEDRAETALREAIEREGNEVNSINIVRRNLNAYNPSLRTVQVSVEAVVAENVFPNVLPLGMAVAITVEVPHGGRLSGP
ncbi:MAG TPA: TadE family protein [Telluria sp.]